MEMVLGGSSFAGRSLYQEVRDAQQVVGEYRGGYE